MQTKDKRPKILVVDDSVMNREILADILEDTYRIVEAENGLQAVDLLGQEDADYSLVLLDIVMPEMDGFEVLAYMNRYHWIETVPVIMISSETATSYITRAFEFGAADFVNRPFNRELIRRRVANTIALYAKQRHLAGMVAEQVYAREKSSRLMISILSHVVEFRNGETGLHILHINTITEMLLRQVAAHYGLTEDDISIITTASSLHDIGKMAIPDEILNKPGRLTAEEFAVMKSHSAVGAEILNSLGEQYTDKLLKTAYKICRWHHERYDGNGYPDGLKGEEIPISAQVVSLADVYDALTSERCYKKAIPHEKAMEMILGGQCGAFNPYLLDCLVAISDDLKREMTVASAPLKDDRSIRQMTQKMLHDEEMAIPVQVLKKLEHERMKSGFYASLLPGTVFKFTTEPPILTFVHPERLSKELPATIVNPFENPLLLERPLSKLFFEIEEAARKAAGGEFHIERTLQWKGEERSFRCDCMTMQGDTAPFQYAGVVGRIQEVSEAPQMAEVCLEETDGLPQYSVTAKQACALQRQLACAFDIVRFVDADETKQICIDRNGEKTLSAYCCYGVWNKTERCENCISGKIKRGHRKASKFEFIDDAVYYVTALHMEVDGKPCSLEMVTHIEDDVFLSSYDSGCLADIIHKQNRKLFMDPVTGVFNRKYFEEKIAVSYDVQAVAILDLDNFKHINDAYGHQVGDGTLQQVAQVISENITAGDEVARYGGDEFIIVNMDGEEQRFTEALKRVSKELSEMSVAGDAGFRITASIGVRLGGRNVPEMVQAAERLMYQAKKEKNCICMEASLQSVRRKKHDNKGML